jgi:hypothetical protein
MGFGIGLCGRRLLCSLGGLCCLFFGVGMFSFCVAYHAWCWVRSWSCFLVNVSSSAIRQRMQVWNWGSVGLQCRSQCWQKMVWNSLSGGSGFFLGFGCGQTWAVVSVIVFVLRLCSERAQCFLRTHSL